MNPRALLRAMFDAAIASAQPALCVPPHLPTPDELKGGRLVVIGAGKASAAMARAVEDHWTGAPEALCGLVVTRHGHAVPSERPQAGQAGRAPRGIGHSGKAPSAHGRIRIVEAAHPVPDAAGLAAAERLLALVGTLRENDVVLCLISGGGSALLPLPLPGITLADKQALNHALLRSGATIAEMNVVRRHLSAIKGGRLAAACHPARVRTLVISDVPGDDPAQVASGPTVADASTCDDAIAVLQRHSIEVPAALRRVLESGAGESIKPGDARLARCETRLIAAPQRALEAAARLAQAAGCAPLILGDAIEGEAREVGTVLAGIARQVAGRGQPLRPPCVLLSGGETTVTVRGAGRGGRNVECLLSLTIALDGLPKVHALMGDTDGVDGQEEIAGALAGPDTLSRARALGLHPRQALADNDGHGFFGALGDAVVTGPTRTNVNDFRAVLVLG